MRVTRVHVNAALSAGSEIELPASAATHLARVLRLREGDACTIFNGDGNDHAAIIRESGKRTVRVLVERSTPVDNESPLSIVLLQGIARGEKMDLILQKATEMGVAGVLPVSSQRSEVKLDAQRAGTRLAHWQAVVVAACEQSGRARVPTVSQPRGLSEALADLTDQGLRLLLDPAASETLSTIIRPAPSTVVLAVGPEGGWSPDDRQQLQLAGFRGLRMGPRVLRTETAGLAAIAALQLRFGDFG